MFRFKPNSTSVPLKLAPSSLILYIRMPCRYDVGNQKIAVVLIGEVLARHILHAWARPGPAVVHGWRPIVLVGMLQPAGKQRGVIGVRSGAIDHDVLAPAIEDMAVRVGEAVGNVYFKLLRRGS